jgi:hypothetical protein
VVNEELQPLAQVNVGLRELPELRTVTDADGGFTFNGLTPGTFALDLQHVAFFEFARSVAVEAGRVTELVITLKARPVEVPYHEGWEHAGYMEAGLGTPVISPRPSTGASIWGGKHDILPGLNTSVSTQVWKSNSAFSASQFRLVIDAGHGELYDQPSKSPHVVRLDGYNVTEKGFLRHDVLVPVTCGCATNPPNGIIDPVVGQRFTIYVTAFYFAPAPSDFSNAPDG